MLQSTIANGRYTSTVLFALSMLVFVAAYWLPELSPISVVETNESFLGGGFMPRIFSALVYVIAAVLLSRQTFFDRGVKWMGAIYLWFVAVSTFVNWNPAIALSSFLFLLSLILLLFCQYSANPVGVLYTSFMLLGVLFFVIPYSLYFIPLYLVFCFQANLISVRGVAALLLGLLTPFWFVIGLAYVFPAVEVFCLTFIDELSTVFTFDFARFTLLHLLLLALALSVLLPATFTFLGGTSPTKPLLRRRLSFVIIADVYILLLFCIVVDGAAFFYVCQLPCVAVLASYLLSKKETRFSNIYMIFVVIMMIALATQSLWLMFL